MLKLIYNLYVAKGGTLDFETFQHPMFGLVAIAIVDDVPVITRWDISLDEAGVKKPSTADLLNAMTAPTLDDVKAEKITALRAACEAEIVSGFASSALGTEHTYPSDMKAQINLMGSVTDSLMPNLPSDWQTPFWVRDHAGAWSFKMHNAAQIQQAGRDGKAHVVACQAALDDLVAFVLAEGSASVVAKTYWNKGFGA